MIVLTQNSGEKIRVNPRYIVTYEVDVFEGTKVTLTRRDAEITVAESPEQIDALISEED